MQANRLADHVVDRIHSLCGPLELDAGPIVDCFCEVVAPWLKTPDGWRSEIADDHTPLELSVTLDETSAFRVLFEPQGDEPSLVRFKEAGIAFHELIEQQHGADLRRFRAVSDLFLPERPQGTFAIWSSLVFSAHAPTLFKAYLNPNAQGRAHAPALVDEALRRFAIRPRLSAATRRGPHLDELKYFALDLGADAHARVKVYVHHHGATAADLEVACEGARNHAPGSVLEFARAMRGGDQPMLARAPFTCHAFDSARPNEASVTAYVPICAYAPHDAAAVERVSDYLSSSGLDPQRYRAVVNAAARRPLDAATGLQSWIALRHAPGTPRLTVYLATEAGRVYDAGSVPAPTRDPFEFATPLALLTDRPVLMHPRLLREPTVAKAIQPLLARFGVNPNPGARAAAAAIASQLALTLGEGAPVRARDEVRSFVRGVMDVHTAVWRTLDDLA